MKFGSDIHRASVIAEKVFKSEVKDQGHQIVASEPCGVVLTNVLAGTQDCSYFIARVGGHYAVQGH